MGENEHANASVKTSIFKVKKVLRALTLLSIIFIFFPSFFVSCSGQNVNVSVMTAVAGVSVYGKKVVDPHPIMLVCLIIPIVALILLFTRKFIDKKIATIILICTAIDLVIWFIFRSAVKNLAEDNYCSFKTSTWYVFNIIVLFTIILLTSLVIAGKMQMDTDLITVFTGANTQSAVNQVSAMMGQMSGTVTQLAGNVVNNIGSKSQKDNVIGFCSKCGSPIAYGCNFCTSCGTPVPESMLAEAETARKAVEEAETAKRVAEEAAGKESERQNFKNIQADQSLIQQNEEKQLFCQQCGAKLETDAIFCVSCGTKV